MKLHILAASIAIIVGDALGSSQDEDHHDHGGHVESHCPQFWVLFKGSCYRYFGEKVTWETAKSKCRDIYNHEGRADLISIHNDEENDFAYDLFHTNAGDATGHTDGPWIGFHRTTSGSTGVFVWSDGSSNTDYESWLSGQPDNTGDIEDCAHFIRRNDADDEIQPWNDNSCSTEMPYICKIKPDH